MEIIVNENNEIVIRLTNGAEVVVEEFGDDSEYASVNLVDRKREERKYISPISSTSLEVSDNFGINGLYTHTEGITSKDIKRSKWSHTGTTATNIKLVGINDKAHFHIFHSK